MKDKSSHALTLSNGFAPILFFVGVVIVLITLSISGTLPLAELAIMKLGGTDTRQNRISALELNY